MSARGGGLSRGPRNDGNDSDQSLVVVVVAVVVVAVGVVVGVAGVMLAMPELPAGFRFDRAAHRYWLHNIPVPSVTDVLRLAGLDSWDMVDPAAMEAARERGRAVHRIIEERLTGVLDMGEIPDWLLPYLAAYEEFRDATGFVADAVEKPLVSVPLRLAGTPDQVGALRKGARAIVDLKSGPVPFVTRYQTAGYALLAGVPLCRRFGLHLGPNGKPSLVEFTDPGDRRVFLGALSVAHAKLSHTHDAQALLGTRESIP